MASTQLSTGADPAEGHVYAQLSDTVSVFDDDDHGPVHGRMAAVSDWQAIDHDIHLYELARQLVQNDGHLLPA